MNPTPTITCIMPTRGRRTFVPRAIRYFQRQSYRNRTLLILDDGPDPVEDLIPTDPRITYRYLDHRYNLGAKRNLACRETDSELIIHWDDDDWIAPWRIQYQVEQMMKHGADVCGLSRLYFYAPEKQQAWEYRYPDGGKPWVAGGTLCYTRRFWEQHPFPEISNGEDTRFVWDKGAHHLLALPETDFYVALIHPGNTSVKRIRSSRWSEVQPAKIQELMGPDFQSYHQKKVRGSLEAAHQSKQSVPMARERATSAQSKEPEYSILMVVHNTLEMVRVSSLQTLRYSAGGHVEFIVVDNASTDGAREWLSMLDRREDIRLIRNDKNMGHGPALEQARKVARGRFLVTLDSDAFPVSPQWLPELKKRLSSTVKVAGILHHRNYIHPSCLLIERQFMNDHGLTFLDQKEHTSGPDVAQPISQYLLHHGFEISGLNRTDARRRGSDSEPVYLGSVYEGLVYHQWYTTRDHISGGRKIDDVPPSAIRTSLEELFAECQAEPRDLAVVVGVRADPEDPRRARNAKVVLNALNQQDVPRWQYRLIVVEQDRSPQLKEQLSPLADRYIFVRISGSYNRGKGFNAGVAQGAGTDRVVCLIDADLLAPPDFLRRGLASVDEKHRAVLPYTEILYLNEQSSRKVLHEPDVSSMWNYNDLGGRTFTSSQGGCLFVDRNFYHTTDGFDERFEGWGYEDREFYRRVARQTSIRRIENRLLHLHHRRPDMTGPVATENKRLLERIETTVGSGDSMDQQVKVRPVPAEPVTSRDNGMLGRRDGERWHRWSPAAVQRILRDEQRQARQRSLRFQTAALAGRLGTSLLDVGCGPGPLWLYRQMCMPGVQITGVDVTEGMVQAARSNFPEIPVQQADAADLPFENGMFDVVLLRHILEHLPVERMENTLREACRAARKIVICGWHLPPVPESRSHTRLTTGGFYENRWAELRLEKILQSVSWKVQYRCKLHDRTGEQDTIWLIEPEKYQTPDPGESDRYPLKFSIIMPTYRRPHTLFRTVRSILNQAYPNWELIVIDNAGEGAYRFADPRITVHEHPEQTGASYARNQGLQYVTGNSICFFDDDDDMYPGYLERFAEAFQAHPEVKMVRCGMHVSNGTVNRSYATPECCIRKQFVTPSWQGYNDQHDQVYFKNLVRRYGWSEQKGDILSIPEALCKANSDPLGGLRGGRL